MRKTFPEDGEIVMCTVTKVYPTSVFVTIDDYAARSGMIHISEIAPGRIRNIREYVEEGKKIVCKVLRIDAQKGHIDLSFRRVTEMQKREKANEIKQAQKAVQIIDYVATQSGVDARELAQKIATYALKEYSTIFNYFEDIATDPTLIKHAQLDKKTENTLLQVILTRITAPKVQVSADVAIKCYAPQGVEIIKNALTTAQTEHIAITYLGGGKYRIVVSGEEYKKVEKILTHTTQTISDMIKKNQGDVIVTANQ